MRRTTLTLGLTGALMLSACFGAPQSEEDAKEMTALLSATGDVGTGGTGTGDAGTRDEGEAEGEAGAPSEKDAARFLGHATFGYSEADIRAVRGRGYAGWIAAQAAMPARSTIARLEGLGHVHHATHTDLFWEYAIENDDQLRQRMAFALGEIVVVSVDDATFTKHSRAFATYTDLLQRHALGNYEDFIRAVAMSPAMGLYLSHIENERADPERGSAADENFARELLQLFTIGLEELTPGGAPTGRPTYGAADVAGLAKVFTGFNWRGGDFRHVKPTDETYFAPMQAYPDYHDRTDKTFLGLTIPGDTAPEDAVDQALSHILAHGNVAPFVSRQLIQRLVTSNPSEPYVARVAAAYEAGRFEADGRRFGDGRRGDMLAVAAAIMLDAEARTRTDDPAFGRVRPPLQRFAQFARTFRDARGAPRGGLPTSTGTFRYDTTYDQRALGAPSVFGYTRPGYRAPGSWTDQAGLVAPQLSMASGAGMVGYINQINQVIRARPGEGGREAFFVPEFGPLMLLADDPDALTAKLDLLLTAGTMDASTKDRIVQAIETIALEDGANDEEVLGTDARRERVEIAVLMAVTAAEYSVQM